MITLTILNTLAILYLLIKGNSTYYFGFEIERTYFKKNVLGYAIILWKKHDYGATSVYKLYIPVRNRRKVELTEEVQRLISNTSSHNRVHTLTAKFSHLKTWSEVRQFEKDYSVVDRKLVERLVSDFATKNNYKL